MTTPCQLCGTKEGILAECHVCKTWRCAKCDCSHVHKGVKIYDR